MSFRTIVEQGLRERGLDCPEPALARLEGFCTLLLEANRVMNLTAVREPEAFAVRHVLDSLALLHCVPLSGLRIIDIGTGPGFPGMPLVLFDPALDITFVDSTAKRIDFIRRAAQQLGVSVTVHAARAEELCSKPGMRESFDAAVSRAVAPLPVLSELCLPFVRRGGVFLPMKSDNEAFSRELSQSQRALRTLGGTPEDTFRYTLPGAEGAKCVPIIRKTGACPPKYPRRYAKIVQNPL